LSLGERAMLAELAAGQAVDAARDAFELAGGDQAGDGDRRQRVLGQVARAQQRALAGGTDSSEVGGACVVTPGVCCNC
jgi:hypothetical protein